MSVSSNGLISLVLCEWTNSFIEYLLVFVIVVYYCLSFKLWPAWLCKTPDVCSASRQCPPLVCCSFVLRSAASFKDSTQAFSVILSNSSLTNDQQFM